MRDGAEQAGHKAWYIELSQPTSSVLANGQSYVSLITVSIFIPTVKKLGNATDTATKSCYCYSSFYGLDCTMLL